MPLTKDQILGALPNLSQADLAMVHAMSGQLLAPTQGMSDTKQVLFDALAATISHPMPYSNMPTNLASQFERHFPDLLLFFDKHFKGWDSNKIVQTGFLRMIFSLIADDLKRHGVTPSIGMLVHNLPRIYEIVDNAFPNYLKNNMGHMILKIFSKRNA